MLIKDVEPIGEPTTLLSDEDIIDRIIELPLRESCRLFRQKGIQTIMSSANKNNIVTDGNKRTKKSDVFGTPDKLLESHYFTEAGNGYAWIMINYNSLSDENKKMLFDLEQTKDNDGNSIGEELVWFIHPFMMTGNIEYGLRSGKFDYNYLKQCMSEKDIPKGIDVDSSLAEFDKRSIVLLYPWEETTESVMLRMPISSKTTVDEVNEYFIKLCCLFKDQSLNNEKNKGTKK